MDEMGKPLYGDVFGTNAVDFQVRNAGSRERGAAGNGTRIHARLVSTQAKVEEEEVDRTPWGELEPSDEESSEEEEEEESEEEKPDETGFFTPADRCAVLLL